MTVEPLTDTSSDIDAVLFDVGNVLIELDYDACFAKWSSNSGVDPTTLRSRFEMTDAYKSYERGHIDAAEYTRDFNTTLQIDLTHDQFLHGWNAMFSGPVAGMQQLLGELHEQVPLFGFSNTNADHVACWPGRFDSLLGKLKTVYVSNELQLRKPDIESYGEVSKRMGVSPDRILFFDDLDANIEGARSAGFKARLFTGAEDARETISRYLDARRRG